MLTMSTPKTFISTLEPRIVWSHFDRLCAIPRASRQEAALRDNLLAWARQRGLASRVDGAGNLLLSKPASPGCECAPGVVLQGHLDMVCQKHAGSAHDFLRDPIRPVLEDGWLRAADTTLGADNGIGVALALAALEQPDLSHPALEVLLTVDEEAGMGGARGLLPGSLTGRRLINLDTEEWGQFYLGCAGGMDLGLIAQLQIFTGERDAAALTAAAAGVQRRVAGQRHARWGLRRGEWIVQRADGIEQAALHGNAATACGAIGGKRGVGEGEGEATVGGDQQGRCDQRGQHGGGHEFERGHDRGRHGDAAQEG